jgi:hypothetical protein
MINNLLLKLIGCIIILMLSNCQNPPTDSQQNKLMRKEGNSSELFLSIKASYVIAHGWGHVYNCEILEVIQGQLNDSLIHLNILNYDSLTNEGLPKIGQTSNLVAHFKQIENDKPYVNFKDAFIDNSKRTWLLLQLKKKTE